MGDFWDGLLWWLPLLAGLVMTLLLVGLVGYPMMYTTISTEGTDTLDALSRVVQLRLRVALALHLVLLVALAYGAVVILFFIVVGSVTVYLASGA